VISKPLARTVAVVAVFAISTATAGAWPHENRHEARLRPQAALTSASGTIYKVHRDTACDLPYGRMILGTTPGYPMAILPDRLGYRSSLDYRPSRE
jgi:hypothetical protein